MAESMHRLLRLPSACPIPSHTLSAQASAGNATAHRQHQTQQLSTCVSSPPQEEEDYSTVRRGLFIAIAALISAPFPVIAETLATLRSERSDTPCAMTVQNMSEGVLKVFWINYDGELELFGVVPPGASYTIDTFETHPWRFVDGATGKTLQDWTASTGEQTVSITKGGSGGLPDQSRPGPAMLLAGGFDGLGGAEASYCPATLNAISIEPEGAVASIAMEGYSSPLPIYVGPAEAAAIISASGMGTRRPSTVSAWQASLQAAGASVKRIVITRLVGHTYYARLVITRLVGHTYYARLVLGLNNGDQRSVDARPSDSIALAMRTEAPLFVSRTIASEQTSQPLDRLMKPDPNPKGPAIHADKLQAIEDDEKMVL